MYIVEVGMKLNKSLDYYDKILKEHGATNCFNCETHDIYYTNITYLSFISYIISFILISFATTSSIIKLQISKKSINILPLIIYITQCSSISFFFAKFF